VLPAESSLATLDDAARSPTNPTLADPPRGRSRIVPARSPSGCRETILNILKTLPSSKPLEAMEFTRTILKILKAPEGGDDRMVTFTLRVKM
jgi:hypothetical protein